MISFTKGKAEGKGFESMQTNTSAPSSPSAKKGACSGCGFRDHAKPNCPFQAHPDYNHTSSLWHHSDKGKAVKSRFNKLKFKSYVSPTDAEKFKKFEA